LQSTLAEAGLRMAGVAARAGTDFPEVARWVQLARLEQSYDAELAARHLRDVQAAKLDCAASPSLPPGIKKIIVLATPDPLPLAIGMLARP
jgi:ATP-dependent helicase/nuclease subunit B